MDKVTNADDYVELVEAMAEIEWATMHQNPAVAKAFNDMKPKSQTLAKGVFIEGFKMGITTALSTMQK